MKQTITPHFKAAGVLRATRYSFGRTGFFLCLFSFAALFARGQTSSQFGFEDNLTGGWTGNSSSETATVNSAAGNVRTGSYSLKLTTSSTSTSNKQWYSNTPYVASGPGIYMHFIYWAKAQDAGTFADASLRYSSSTPPSGSGSSSNASADVPLSTTVWTVVTSTTTTSSNRYYFPAPRKTVSTGATSIFLDDGVLYTSADTGVDISGPQAPSAVSGTVSGNLVSLSWTSNTDTGNSATGVAGTIILRTANLTATSPVLNNQGMYSVAGGSAGPNTVNGWTVVSASGIPSSTSFLDITSTPGSYKYAVVLRDFAYNYSVAGVSGTIVAANPIPTIIVDTTGFSRDFGNVIRGSFSTEHHYNVLGLNLSGNVTITAPAGFQVSTTSGAGFASSVTLPQTAGSTANTTVYVRFAPVGATGATGNVAIVHTAAGAITQNVIVSGNALDAEPTTGGTITFGTITDTKIEVNLPTVGNGNKRIIVVKSGSDVTFVPVDGAPVSGVNANFSTATNQGSGDKVVYDGGGSGNSVVTVTGLAPTTTYYFAVYEYNTGTGTSQNYSPVSPVTALARTQFPLGTGNLPAPGGIRIFPNPVQDRLHIESPLPVQVTIRDLTGRIVYHSNDKEADLTGIAGGMYTITVTDEKGILLLQEKLLKAK